MSDVIHLSDHRLKHSSAGGGESLESKILSGAEFKAIREENKIYRRQIAAQFCVSVNTVERWENSYVTPVTDTLLGSHISAIRLKDKNFNDGKNLCFGRFPLRLAREILGYNILEIATRYKCTESQWKKFEYHTQKIPAELLLQIEADVRMSLVGDC